MSMTLSQYRDRLRFRSHHRGMLEMDLLLGGFADRHVGAMDAAALDAYEALLVEQDQDVYDWYLGRSVPPADKLTPVLQLFLAYKIHA
jgi:antitoxin CptB